VDKMLVLFPFEKDFYLEHKINAEWVGHPLIDELSPKNTQRTQIEISERPRVGLFPGSRPSEIKFHGPLLKESVFELRKKFPQVQFKVAVANTISPKALEPYFDPTLIDYSMDSRKVLKWADCGLIASGTATLEAAVAGLPFCLFYQVSKLNEIGFRWIVRYQGPLGMANVLMKRPVVREFFQSEAKVTSLVEECSRMITDENYRLEMKKNLLECRSKLDSGGGSQRAAKEVISALTDRVPNLVRGTLVLTPQNS
jgi:lipid-A-disaccharide synthase